MRTTHSNQSIAKILALCVLGILLFYPPFAFFIFLNDVTRISIFVFFFILLFGYQLSSKYKARKLLVLTFIWVLILIFLAGALYVNNSEGYRTALGYSLMLGFACVLYGIMQSTDNGFYEAMVNVYIGFFILAPACACINFLINLVTPGFNFLTGAFSIFTYEYQASPFGLVIYKNIRGINVSRSLFFFIEPVFLSFFYLVNIFVISKRVGKHKKLFIVLNFLGGLLTTSFFFYIGYIVLRALKMRLLYRIIFIVLALVLGFILQQGLLGFLNSSSYEERTLRLTIGLEILSNFNLQRVLTGSGYFVDYGYNLGVSSGILNSFIEGGIIGLICPLIMAIIFCRKSVALLVLLIFSLILFEPFKFPLFWLALILGGQTYYTERKKQASE